MGYILQSDGLSKLSEKLRENYVIYGPFNFFGEGEFSDSDCVRYSQLEDLNDMELDLKSSHTFKEILLPISETLLYFTEDSVKESNPHLNKRALVFVRSCDLHSIRRLDAIYLKNGFEDHYYARARKMVDFALIGCEKSYENCFCVDAGTNRSHKYSISIHRENGDYVMDAKEEFEPFFSSMDVEEREVVPAYVKETESRVKFVEDLDPAVILKSSTWDEYDTRCIACGRCNFSCPTCTCNTMQDIFYGDNPKVGERRRVWASCMVDNFTTVAGGGEYRKQHGQRMRFKVMHKAYDYKQRFGEQMCVGCGRCDDVCPEYISFRAAVNRLGDIMKENCEND